MKRILVCMYALVMASGSSYGVMLKYWEFDDVAGTPAYQTVNTGTAPLSFASDVGNNNSLTDGNGLMVLDETVDEGHASSFGSIIQTGHVTLRVDFAAWDFTDTLNTAANSIASVMLNDYTGNDGSLIGIKHEGSGVTLSLGGTDSAGQSDYLTLPTVSTDGLSVILDRDITAKTVAAWYRFESDASTNYTYLTTFGASRVAVNQVKMINDGSVGYGDNYVEIDRIGVGTSMEEVLAIPEPTSLAFIGVLGGACLWVRRIFAI